MGSSYIYEMLKKYAEITNASLGEFNFNHLNEEFTSQQEPTQCEPTSVLKEGQDYEVLE